MSDNVGGKIISASSNLLNAFNVISNYLASENQLNAVNTQLTQTISNRAADCTTEFQYQMEHPTGDNKDYIHILSTGKDDQGNAVGNEPNKEGLTIQSVTTQYTAANAKNQATLKIYDGQSQMMQGLLNQYAQTQQSIVQMMGLLNQPGANLIHLLSSV